VRRDSNISLDLNDLNRYRKSVNSLVYYDTDDSTGNIRSNELALVDYYYKQQLLTDQDRYLKPIYGSCIFTDFYYNEYSVQDTEKKSSVQVKSKKDLDKLRVGWNIGIIPKIFLPYNNTGWSVVEAIPNAVYQKIPWDYLLGASPLWKSAYSPRSVDVSGRFSTSYPRKTVEYHRNQMIEALEGWFDADKVSKRRYWSELRNAKVLLSPFGLGEICHRDFEGFLSGNIVLKPNMEHLETWPPLFEAGETYIDISWDMDDAEETLSSVLNQYNEYRTIAKTGQQRYKRYLVGEAAAKRFADHFERLIKDM
jgi:hypothetical protein